MAVVSTNEVIKRGGDLVGVHETISRNWQIVVDDPHDNSRTIANSEVGVTLPNLFESHPDNIFATCRSLGIKQSKGLIWNAKAMYSTEPITQDERERADEPIPIDRDVKISWSATSYDKVTVKDLADKAVVNSAGDYYDPPPAITWERLTFHFRKNYVTTEPWVLDYINSVNESGIIILAIEIPAEKAKFSQPSGGEEQEENGQLYHETSWDIEVDVRTWQLEILDEGLREIDGTDRVNMTDVSGADLTSPAMLDGFGAKLADPTLDNAVFNEHKVYYLKDYTQLPGVSPG